MLDGIEYKIVLNPHSSIPMIARVDNFPIKNRKEVCRRYLLANNWTNEMFVNKNTNELEKEVNYLVNGNYVPSEIGNPRTKKKAKNIERLNPHMSQTEEILFHLRNRGSMTQRDLSVAMYGDSNHLPNLYESLMSLVRKGYVARYSERPSYYCLSSQEIFMPNDVAKEFSAGRRIVINREIPSPSAEEVNYWLKTWKDLDDYESQERAVNRVFNDYKDNKNIENILIKCSILNDFYSTNIFKIYPVAKHILSLDIDYRLNSGDPTLVDDISRNNVGGKDIYFYSFASKYCSHHNPKEYPIYDYYVDIVLRHFRDKDNFDSFTNSDLKKYASFKKILFKFREYYCLSMFSIKELDQYLWQFGKKYFPKSYKKKKA